MIERSEFAPYIEQNRINIEADPLVYKKRQSIVEHPYGTIKRQWGFYYVITKRGMKRASADVGFMFIAYNLRRIMNILCKNALKRFLRELCSLFFEKSIFQIVNKAFGQPSIFQQSGINYFLRAA